MTYEKILRIGIDTLPVVRNESGGGERCVDNLLKNLSQIDRKNEYYVFCHPSYSEFVKSLGKNFFLVEMNKFNSRTAYRIIGQQVIIPWIARKNKLHLVHSMGNLSPFYSPCPLVVSILCMVNFTQPQLFTPYCRRVYFNYAMTKSVQKAKKVICISEYEKKQIGKYTNSPSDKIKVVYCGVDEQFKVSSSTAETPSKIAQLGIKKPYILSASAFRRLKNIETMIKVFHVLREKYNVPHQFVLTGPIIDYEYFAEVKNIIKELNEEDNVLILGNVPKEILYILYSSADLLLFLSFAEAFGIPLIEAMASGVPVVTSNSEALPEIAGEAGLVVNSASVEEAVSACYRVISDKQLRSEMIKKGLERAKIFSWEKAARNLLSIYQEVGNNNQGINF
ncbi:MAG: glycosyltransferase family 1 protein [Sedimentisphaerales bacterium]